MTYLGSLFDMCLYKSFFLPVKPNCCGSKKMGRTLFWRGFVLPIFLYFLECFFFYLASFSTLRTMYTFWRRYQYPKHHLFTNRGAKGVSNIPQLGENFLSGTYMALPFFVHNLYRRTCNLKNYHNSGSIYLANGFFPISTYITYHLPFRVLFK